MREYVGTRGRNNYLISLDTNEAHNFDSFGDDLGAVSVKDALLSVRNIKVDVDILSIVGSSMGNMSEVYFQGKVLLVNLPYLEVYATLSKKVLRFNHIIYRVKHKGSAQHILLPLVKGMTNHRTIEVLLGATGWTSLYTN